MKTSTKLILIYVGLIVAGVLTLFITSNSHKDKEKEKEKEKVYSEVIGWKKCNEKLPDFSVVLIQDSLDCELYVGDSCKIQWIQPHDYKQKGLTFSVRNDTLFFVPTSDRSASNIQIKAKRLTSVVVKNKAYLWLWDSVQKELSMQLDNATCILGTTDNQDKAKKKSETLHLIVDARNSSKVVLKSGFQALTANLDSSYLEVSNVYANRTTLNMKHKSSSLFYVNPKQLTMQKDSTSTFRIY